MLEKKQDAELVNDMRQDLIKPKSKGWTEFGSVSSEKPKSTSSSSRDERSFQGQDSYRISFKPADKEDLDWAGEAYIHANDFEPI